MFEAHLCLLLHTPTIQREFDQLRIVMSQRSKKNPLLLSQWREIQNRGIRSASENLLKPIKEKSHSSTIVKWLNIVFCSLVIMALIGMVQWNFYPLSYYLDNRLPLSTGYSQQETYEAEPRNLRSYYSDRTVNHYPFTGLADVSTKASETETAFYWHIPRSGGTTLKHIFGKCLHLVQASRTSAEYCDVENKKLHVCNTRIGAFVNADTSDNHGIQRANELKLLASGLTDVIISSRFLHAISLFDQQHTGRAFTIIRDPLERAVSTFYYLKNADWEPTHKDMFKEMSFMEYIHRDDTGSDWMVRWLTGKQNEPVLTEKDLKLAKMILEKKFLILLTEEMRISVDRLITYMGWEIKDEYRNCVKENVAKVSRHNKSIHPQVKVGTKEYNALKSKNKFDFELYDFALELFRDQWAVVYRRSNGISSNTTHEAVS